MPEISSGNNPTYKPSDLFDPQSWINLQSYGALKEWLRQATQHRIFLPVVIPHNVMPASHLAQLLIQSSPRTKTYLRTIIPELIKEWGRNDNPEALDDLLILCGNLNCNEAETAIGRIVTEKLADPGDTKLRRRALSVLQEIGTDRSLHVFKRYIGDFDYAALCYRSLYLLNLNYAVTELEGLIRLYHWRDAADELADVLKILFKYTLKPPQYICVFQPLVEQTPPDTFIPVLELLHSMNILNDESFAELPMIARVNLFKQIVHRATEGDSARIFGLLDAVGATLDPPAISPVVPEPLEQSEPVTSRESVRRRNDNYFMLKFRDSEEAELISYSELGPHKTLLYSLNYIPDQNEIESILEQGPVQ